MGAPQAERLLYRVLPSEAMQKGIPARKPDTLDRLQDGTAAAILFRVTRRCFHPAQTMLNAFREPQRAVLEVQQTLEGAIPASALFADLSKAFERVNAFWILHILHIRQCAPPF